MPLLHWFRLPRSLLTLYLVGVAAGVLSLAWLAGRLIDQEQAVESQRAREQLETSADRSVAVFQRSLVDLERRAFAAGGSLPPDSVAVVADRASIRSRPSSTFTLVIPTETTA